MSVQQEGLGRCNTCGGPLLQAINQPGIKGVCLGCQASAQPKTGKTVVVRSETGETSNAQATVTGGVVVEEVPHQVGASSKVVAKTPPPVKAAPTLGTLTLELNLSDLAKGNIEGTLLQAVYDGIDNMPPFATIKETKQALKLQEQIELKLRQIKGDK